MLLEGTVDTLQSSTILGQVLFGASKDSIKLVQSHLPIGLKILDHFLSILVVDATLPIEDD